MNLPTKLQTEIKGLLNMDIGGLSETELRYQIEDLLDECEYDMVDYVKDSNFPADKAVIGVQELQYLNRVRNAYSLFMDTMINELDKSKHN